MSAGRLSSRSESSRSHRTQTYAASSRSRLTRTSSKPLAMNEGSRSRHNLGSANSAAKSRIGALAPTAPLPLSSSLAAAERSSAAVKSVACLCSARIQLPEKLVRAYPERVGLQYASDDDHRM